MKVIAYTRVSTREQIEGYSLASQEDAIKEYCRRQGWEVVEVFREMGESAKTTNRTQLRELLEYCRKNKGKINYLVVHRFDRIARSAIDHQFIKATLLKSQVVLRSATQQTDDSSSGKLLENMFSAIAQFDNDLRSERTKEGMLAKFKDGYWPWGAPLGYQKVKGELRVNLKVAPYIQEMFEMYAVGGYTYKHIAERLYKKGIKSSTGKRLSKQSVFKILSNKLYMGIQESKTWGLKIEGQHKRIVSPELFNKVQMIKDGKILVATPHLVNNPEFPLKNVSQCGNCFKNLTGSHSRGRRGGKYAYYHCAGCGKTRVPKKDLEVLFFKNLQQIQPAKNVQKLLSTVLADVWKTKQEESSTGLERIDTEIMGLKKRKRLMLEKNLSKVISDADYKEQVEILDSDIAVREIERADYRQEGSDASYVINLTEGLLSNISTLWLEAPFEQKLQFQGLVFPKGIVYKDKKFRTPELGLPFSLITPLTSKKSTLAPQRVTVQNQIIPELVTFYTLFASKMNRLGLEAKGYSC